jgi:hypothetical protein
MVVSTPASVIPLVGRGDIPCVGVGYWQSSAMREKPSPRQVLSENIRSLMDAHPELGTIKKVASASNSALSNGKVGRICKASHTTDIDTLQDLADVFKLEPWQLLVRGLNPSALPRLADASVLAQILEAVERRQATLEENVNVGTPAHQVKHEARPKETPALAKVVGRTKGKSRARSKSGGVQKPRTDRGS